MEPMVAPVNGSALVTPTQSGRGNNNHLSLQSHLGRFPTTFGVDASWEGYEAHGCEYKDVVLAGCRRDGCMSACRAGGGVVDGVA